MSDQPRESSFNRILNRCTLCRAEPGEPHAAFCNHPGQLHRGALFAAIGTTIQQGDQIVGRMASKTLAKRAANALNRYQPNAEGV